MTPQEAADLAARTLAAIPDCCRIDDCAAAADRERVASDLAGIEQHDPVGHLCIRNAARAWTEGCADAARYATGLVRTAALYGVTP